MSTQPPLIPEPLALEVVGILVETVWRVSANKERDRCVKAIKDSLALSSMNTSHGKAQYAFARRVLEVLGEKPTRQQGAGVVVPPALWLAGAALGTVVVLASLAAIPARVGARRPVSPVLQADSA